MRDDERTGPWTVEILRGDGWQVLGSGMSEAAADLLRESAGADGYRTCMFVPSSEPCAVCAETMPASTGEDRVAAAAPNLLAALRHAYDVLGTFHHEDPTNEVMVQAYEAIVKATGSDVIA